VQISEFFWQVENEPRLRGIDLRAADSPEDDVVVVEDLQSEYKTTFTVPVILENDWSTLLDIALGKKNIAPLYHVTRIVGYYSRIENWNKSKLGELADRRRGNYAVAS